MNLTEKLSTMVLSIQTFRKIIRYRYISLLTLFKIYVCLR